MLCVGILNILCMAFILFFFLKILTMDRLVIYSPQLATIFYALWKLMYSMPPAPILWVCGDDGRQARWLGEGTKAEWLERVATAPFQLMRLRMPG